MKITIAIVKYIFAVILALLVAVYLLINILTTTVLNETYILSKLEETNYYNKINENIKSNFEKYIYQSGLDESVIENIVTIEKIKKDTQIIISNIYDGVEQKVDTQEIKDKLNNNINQTLNQQNLNNSMKDSINTFVDHICNEYTDTMSHFSYENKINETYIKAMKYINIAKKIILIAIALDFILLIVLNFKRIYKSGIFIGISCAISGSILIIINIFTKTKIKIQTITVLNDAISEVIRNISSEILEKILSYGIVLVSSGVILIILSNIIHNFRKYGLEKIENTNENMK